MDLKSGSGAIHKGDPKEGAKPGVTLTLDDDNMVKIVSGQLNPQQVPSPPPLSSSPQLHGWLEQAFMSGKLKLKGNIMLTQKLQVTSPLLLLPRRSLESGRC